MYKENYQLTVNRVRQIKAQEYDLKEFMRSTQKDMDKLSEQLFQFIDEINDSYLKSLLLAIFEDKKFYTEFANSPAAKSWHHNYLGGLLEHTVSVTNICNILSSFYPVDKDILIAGAILHDLGKVFEYSIKTTIDFSDIGRLVGHICLGDRYVCQKAEKIDNFPDDTLMKIRHMILAHQGEYENASARLPQTIEAMILFHVDNLDAQAQGINQLVMAVQNDKAKWTDYNRIHNRYFYLG